MEPTTFTDFAKQTGTSKTATGRQQKILVFYHHSDVGDIFEKHFGTTRTIRIDGDTPVAKRQILVDKFQNDPTCDIALLSIQAAGVGLTLTAANIALFAELDWVPGNMSQAEDRAHRIGQIDNVLVYHCVIQGTIDATMIHKLVEKQIVMDAALDDKLPEDEYRMAAEIHKPIEIDLSGIQTVSDEEIANWLNRQEDTAKTVKTARQSARADEKAEEKGYAAEAYDMTPEEIQAVHRGLSLLAGVCDGAQEQDGMGFNGGDTFMGRLLGNLPEITPLQAAYGRAMIKKYVKQLGRTLIDQMGEPKK
jgi:hypothetical protein